MSQLLAMKDIISEKLGQRVSQIDILNNELTLEIRPADILDVCEILRDNEGLKFELLMDVCGVDYLHHGVTEWETTNSTASGFERGVHSIRDSIPHSPWPKPRFCVVYHLLSVTLNQRIRLKVFLEDTSPAIDSVIDIWASANWYEREAFDLYGILFKGHPDLRRILTDYGFVGHPFRKDFPLEGNVEVRYDAKKKRVIYEPVDITPRTLVPKVIRKSTKEMEG
tara:strand:- start:30900 stop:31571 length:672 start_codon:yes stop_codon:yes gene_type:complete